jgi:sulfite reductase alpha subunit-like flavoprotein
MTTSPDARRSADVPDQDYLYQDELREFEKTGVVRVVAALSRVPGQPRTGKSQADADAWLTGLRAGNRYLEDIWGGVPAGPA